MLSSKKDKSSHGLGISNVRKAVAKKLFEYKDKKILDLCCGTGNQLKILAENGVNVVISPAEIGKRMYELLH